MAAVAPTANTEEVRAEGVALVLVLFTRLNRLIRSGESSTCNIMHGAQSSLLLWEEKGFWRIEESVECEACHSRRSSWSLTSSSKISLLSVFSLLVPRKAWHEPSGHLGEAPVRFLALFPLIFGISAFCEGFWGRREEKVPPGHCLRVSPSYTPVGNPQGHADGQVSPLSPLFSWWRFLSHLRRPMVSEGRKRVCVCVSSLTQS